MNIGKAVGVPGQGCRNRGAAKAAQTILLPGQHPLPDSAGGCWKGVKPVGFIIWRQLEVLTRRLGRGWRKGHVWVLFPHCAVSWGRGPGSSLRPPRNGGGKLGHSSAPQHPTAALEKAFALSPFMAWRSYRTVAAPVANGKQNFRELGTRPSPQHTQPRA